MFTKMRESKGFKVVELMILVAIIGVLAAFAVPHYHPKVMLKARSHMTVAPCSP